MEEICNPKFSKFLFLQVFLLLHFAGTDLLGKKRHPPGTMIHLYSLVIRVSFSSLLNNSCNTFRGGKGQLPAVALSSTLLVLSFTFLPAGLQIKGAMSQAESFRESSGAIWRNESHKRMGKEHQKESKTTEKKHPSKNLT